MNASDVEWPTCQDKLRSLEAETVTAETPIETEKPKNLSPKIWDPSRKSDPKKIGNFERKKIGGSHQRSKIEQLKDQGHQIWKRNFMPGSAGPRFEARPENLTWCSWSYKEISVDRHINSDVVGRKVGDREVSRSLLVLGCQEKTDIQMFGAQLKSRWFWFPNLLQGRKWIHPLGWSTSSYRAQFLSAVIDLAKGWMTLI